MKHLAVLSVAVALLGASQAHAQGMISAETQKAFTDIKQTLGMVPTFFRMLPQEAVVGLWQEMKGIYFNPRSELPQKYKSMIGLAVDAQTPCVSCLYFDSEMSRAQGASEGEVKEAAAMAGLTRHWSTFLNGSQMEMAAFKRDTDQVLQNARDRAAGTAPKEQAGSASPAAITHAAEAYTDMERTMGIVPGFLRAYPAQGIVGAWKEMKAIQLSETKIPNKYKELIGLAVAAQVPCNYCTYFHTESAKFHGASSAEIKETLALASLTRNWSTLMAGLQMDPAVSRREIKQIVNFVRANPPKQLGGEAQPQGVSTAPPDTSTSE